MKEDEIIVPEEFHDSEEIHVVEPPMSRAESTPEIIEREVTLGIGLQLKRTLGKRLGDRRVGRGCSRGGCFDS